MYQPKVRHILSPMIPDAAGSIEERMWPLFLDIGAFWKLNDEPDLYRIRFAAFLANRISLNPLYEKFYALAARLLDTLTQELGHDEALKKLFTNRDHRVPAPLATPQFVPETELEIVQIYVVNEFIALRMALGGFAEFGAKNYYGYMGGANLDPLHPPYRKAYI